MISFDFFNPTRIVFGSGKLNELGNMPMPGKKAMLLISNGKSTKVNGSLYKTTAQLKKAGVAFAVFDKIMESPLREVIMKGAAFAKENGCDGQFVKMAKAMGIKEADKPEDFITALVKLQEDCGVAGLKMSDYGFTSGESMTLAKGCAYYAGRIVPC